MNEKIPELTVPDVRGRVKLDLVHPRSGKVLKTVESENFVHPLWQVNSRRYGRSHFYSGNPVQPIDERLTTYGMNIVYLASGGGVFSRSDLDGTLTAYAEKNTYSGGSLKRGSIIAAECSSDRNHSTYVWEWPTTAGNGIIRSVGMTYRILSERFVDPQAKYARAESGSSAHYYMPNGSHMVYVPGESLLWYLSSTAVTAYPTSVVETLYPEISVPTFDPAATRSVARDKIGFPSNNLTGLALSPSYMFVAAGTSSVKKFLIPTTLGADPTETSISVSGRTAMNRLTHDGSYLWVSEGANVYRVNDSTGAIERSFPVVAAPDNMWWYAERSLLLVLSGYQYYAYGLDGSLVFESNCMQAIGGNGNASVPFGSQNYYAYLGNGEYVSHNQDNYTFYIEQFGRLETCSRSSLGVEIEKTNLTGMKLTYTFEFA